MKKKKKSRIIFKPVCMSSPNQRGWMLYGFSACVVFMIFCINLASQTFLVNAKKLFCKTVTFGQMTVSFTSAD
jgi:hypothetical protein